MSHKQKRMQKKQKRILVHLKGNKFPYQLKNLLGVCSPDGRQARELFSIFARVSLLVVVLKTNIYFIQIGERLGIYSPDCHSFPKFVLTSVFKSSTSFFFVFKLKPEDL